MKDLLVSLIKPYDFFYIDHCLHQANYKGVYQNTNNHYVVMDTHSLIWDINEITRYVGPKDTFTYQELCEREYGHPYPVHEEGMARRNALAKIKNIMQDELGPSYFPEEISEEDIYEFLEATEFANCPIYFDKYGNVREDLLNTYQLYTYNCLI